MMAIISQTVLSMPGHLNMGIMALDAQRHPKKQVLLSTHYRQGLTAVEKRHRQPLSLFNHLNAEEKFTYIYLCIYTYICIYIHIYNIYNKMLTLTWRITIFIENKAFHVLIAGVLVFLQDHYLFLHLKEWQKIY